MEIDTLFLSGGGVNCLSFLGSIQQLIHKNIIKHNLKGIKHIVGVSGGILHIIPLLLGYTIESTIKLFIEYDYTKLINYHEIMINNLFKEYGAFNNDFIDLLISVLLKKKGYSKNITLKDFYKINNINLVIKVINISKRKIEYLNYKKTPNIPLVTAIKMTTCVPLLFRPIKYNNDLYVDGGLCGKFPFEYKKKIKTKKYLGLRINCNHKNDFNDITDFISSLFSISFSPYDHIKIKKIIDLNHSNSGLYFNITKDDKIKMIEKGKEGINHLLTQNIIK